MGSRQSGEGAGREFQRVADTLRSQLADGGYPVDAVLPTQRQLAETFGVSRDTVQRALRELADEGWIESRQGSGSRVLKSSQTIHTSSSTRKAGTGRVTLAPFIRAAFEQPEVTLDAFTLTSESLDTHLRVQSERVRSGEIGPRRITVRLLLPDLRQPSVYPRNVADPEDLRPLERLRDISRRHADSLRDTLHDLRREGLVAEADLHVGHVPQYPTAKLYLLNGTDALHGFYDLTERKVLLPPDDEEVVIRDVLGVGATLFHYAKDGDPGSQGSVFVEAAQVWFDSHWKVKQ
ncbi:winged helix-turn-helix domain-containing protein [Streptomyces sp. NPDC001970]